MAKTPKSIATLKNPLALRQRRWVRKLGYTPPSLKRGRKRTFDDIRLRRFKTFRPALERRLKPPVEADEGQAKALSSENRYPVFESGHLSHHEDTVGEVLESLDSAVMEIERSGQHTEAQAAAIRAELENFRALAKAAYESANRSDVLAQEATALYEESRQALEQRASRCLP